MHMVIILHTNPRYFLLLSFFLTNTKSSLCLVVPWIDLPNGQAKGRSPHLCIGQDRPHRSQGQSIVFGVSQILKSERHDRFEMRFTLRSERSTPFFPSSVNLDLSYQLLPSSLFLLPPLFAPPSSIPSTNDHSTHDETTKESTRKLSLAFQSFLAFLPGLVWGGVVWCGCRGSGGHLICVLFRSTFSFRLLAFCRILKLSFFILSLSLSLSSLAVRWCEMQGYANVR